MSGETVSTCDQVDIVLFEVTCLTFHILPYEHNRVARRQISTWRKQPRSRTQYGSHGLAFIQICIFRHTCFDREMTILSFELDADSVKSWNCLITCLPVCSLAHSLTERSYCCGETCHSNGACHPGGHHWNYYLDTLSLYQVIETYFQKGYLWMKSTSTLNGALKLKGHQNDCPGNHWRFWRHPLTTFPFLWSDLTKMIGQHDSSPAMAARWHALLL